MKFRRLTQLAETGQQKALAIIAAKKIKYLPGQSVGDHLAEEAGSGAAFYRLEIQVGLWVSDLT